jgi:hypothetical protein
MAAVAWVWLQALRRDRGLAGRPGALDAGCSSSRYPGGGLDGIASLTVASLLDLDVGLLHGLVTAAG